MLAVQLNSRALTYYVGGTLSTTKNIIIIIIIKKSSSTVIGWKPLSHKSRILTGPSPASTSLF
jgi:hypothetical protein